jgi:conjugal transfer pilus assembly protein TraK
MRTIITLLFFLVSPVHAVQEFSGDTGEVIKATASKDEPNIITIEGGSIESVWGAEGKLTLEPNNETGQAIFRPITDKRFTLFVQSLSGTTYTLSIMPKNGIIGQSIVINESINDSRLNRFTSTGNTFRKRVSDLLKQIESKPGVTRIRGFRLSSVNKVIPLWRETNILHAVSWSRKNLIVDKFVLTNVSDDLLVVEEREFRNLLRDIRAISIRDHQLKPAQSTVLYAFRNPS